MNEVMFAPAGQPGRARMFLKRLFWTAAGSCALGGLYAWRFGDHWLRIERLPMPIRNLGPEFVGRTIAHVSDLHSSPIVLERYLNQCVGAINDMGVDFVALTGDFITGPRHYARRVARILRHLKPRIASVACLGNHDYGILHPRGIGEIRGLAEYLADQLTHADIFVMLNESRTFHLGESALQFVGVEDYWCPRYNPYLAFDLARANLPTIGLCHNPDAAMQMAHCGADWVLSGHTHGSGLPDTAIRDLVMPASQKSFVAGLYDLGNQRWLYVNRGLGYGRRFNINSRPEITIFTLCRAEEPAGE